MEIRPAGTWATIVNVPILEKWLHGAWMGLQNTRGTFWGKRRRPEIRAPVKGIWRQRWRGRTTPNAVIAVVALTATRQEVRAQPGE